MRLVAEHVDEPLAVDLLVGVLDARQVAAEAAGDHGDQSVVVRREGGMALHPLQEAAAAGGVALERLLVELGRVLVKVRVRVRVRVRIRVRVANLTLTPTLTLRP